MEEVTSSSFRICWNEPECPGSPYFTGYEITYNDKQERIRAENCFNFDSDHLEWGQSHNIAVSAVIESGNEIVAEGPSSNLTLLMGMFLVLIIVHIG